MSVIAFPTGAQAPNRLKCSACGIEVDAGCDCGAPYVPAAKRVADYDKANPGQSTRQAAADLGISNKTVSKARQAVTEVTPGATVAGRDGKNYPAKKSKTKEEVEIIERDRKACIALYEKVKDAEREKAQWLLDHPHVDADDAATSAAALMADGEDTCVASIADPPERLGEFLERLGTDSFFAALQHAPKLKAEINRRVVALHSRKTKADKQPKLDNGLLAHALEGGGNGVDPAVSAEKRKQDNAATDRVPA